MKKGMLLTAIIFSLAVAVPSAFAQSAQDSIFGLINAVKIIPFSNYGIENSLLVKLEGARSSLVSANSNAAVNKLHAFKNEVRVLDSIFAKRGLQFPGTFLQTEADYAMSTIENTTVLNVGASGGTVTVTDSSNPVNGASVTISQGAVSSETLITITPDTTPPPLPSTVTPSGPAATFGPDGLTFNQPVTITIPYTTGAVLNEPNLKLFTRSESSDAWTEVSGITIDTVNKLIQVAVSHFSTFQAAEGTGNPDAPTINWAVVWSTTTAAFGKGVMLAASVTNPLAQPGDFLPDTIASLEVTGPDNSLYYKFVKGDYLYRVQTHTEHFLEWLPLSAYAPSGDYTFTVTTAGGTSSMTKTLSVSGVPVPIVEAATIQFYNYATSDWQSADKFEGAPLDKDLRIRWNSAVGYWYSVQFANMNGTVVYESPRYLNPLEISIPYDVLNTFLIPNASFRMRVTAFDAQVGSAVSNRSLSPYSLFTTGFASLNSPLFNYGNRAMTWRGHRPDSGGTTFTELGIASTLFIPNQPTTFPEKSDFDYVKVVRPNNQELDISNLGTHTRCAGNVACLFFWYTEPLADITSAAGDYVFKAKIKNGPEVQMKDYLSRPRLMPFGETLSPGNLEFNVFETINSNPEFQWNFLSEAKAYQVEVEILNANNSYNRTITSGLLPNAGDSVPVPSYTFASGVIPLTSGSKYRWRIRALDGNLDVAVDIDNYSLSRYRYFQIQ